MWLDHLDYNNRVYQAWHQPTSRTRHFCIHDWLKSTKKAFQYWNKFTFGNLQRQISEITKQIDALHILPYTTHTTSVETSLQSQRDLLLQAEEIFWKQKSGDNYIKLGDRNTKFFHATTICRRHRNSITFLKSSDGDWFYDRADIA